jgi:hypothetical protein
MSTITTQTITSEDPGIVAHYETAKATIYGDWRDDFYKNGYAVIKHAVSEAKAKAYQDRALEWVQSFNLGLDLKDPSTWTKEHLPQSFKSMYHAYCAGHEKFMWDART